MHQILSSFIFSNYSYLFFHLIVLGSIFISKIFYKKMVLPKKEMLLKAIPASIFFIIWDILVTNKWWFFNDQFILNLPKILTIPIEELLFFFTVPFGLLTFLENLIILLKNDDLIVSAKNKKYLNILLFIILAIVFFFTVSSGWWYTATIIFGLLIFKNHLLSLTRSKYLGLIFTLFTTFIFNYYLTSLPIVTYDNIYKSSILILTIPLEDFGYGVLLYLLITKLAYAEKKPSIS